MKKLAIIFILGLALQFGGFSTSFAQDTVSTADVQFTTINPVKPPVQTQKVTAKKAATKTAAVGQQKQTLWAIFAAGFLGGLAALFMPCIFPMLPLTVSYFTKKAHSKRKAIRTAIQYGLSIVAIYVVLGLLITVIFGADALNSLATNGIFNLLFFVLLVVFAASF